MPPAPDRADFLALLDKNLPEKGLAEGQVVAGQITQIEGDYALIDVGLKTEGRVPLSELPRSPAPAVDDAVDVYIERVENALGEAVLSCEKARREKAWMRIEEVFRDNEQVEGTIVGRVKGGFTVDLGGAMAFLPGSQVDMRPTRDMALPNTPLSFQILKMDRRRNNIVVSRRSVSEESRSERYARMSENLAEGQIIDGVVKNITDYGAFVDLGGIDGLLHVTHMAWRRIVHPSEVLKVGETAKVKIVKINPETQRISLSIKELEDDPWKSVPEKYPTSTKLKGRVTNVTDYGAFVELQEGVEGLVHVSEMSWLKKNTSPDKLVSVSQEVEVVVLEVDMSKRRISLGMKQCMENPWEAAKTRYPPGTRITGKLRNIAEFGLFINLEEGLDGMVHVSDLEWDGSGEERIKTYEKGQDVEAIILEVDAEKERIALGIKQLAGDPLKDVPGLEKNAVITCTVLAAKEKGIEVTIGDGAARVFIRRSDLARERSEQRPDRFAPGERVDARVQQFNRETRHLVLSIKALEIAEEKAAVEQYGSADSGSSLGDILGRALNKKADTGDETDKADTEVSKKATKEASKKAAKEKSSEDSQETPAEDADKTEA